MARHRPTTEPKPCPFMDLDDPRCARHFSLTRMQEAFDTCLDHYDACATYSRIQAEQRVQIRLTLFGQPIADAPVTPAAPAARVHRDVPRLRQTGS